MIGETTSKGVLICYADSRVRFHGIGYWMMGTYPPMHQPALWYGPERGWEPVKEKK